MIEPDEQEAICNTLIDDVFEPIKPRELDRTDNLFSVPKDKEVENE